MRKTLLICSSILLGSCLIAYACQLNGRYHLTSSGGILDTRKGLYYKSGMYLFDMKGLDKAFLEKKVPFKDGEKRYKGHLEYQSRRAKIEEEIQKRKKMTEGN